MQQWEARLARQGRGEGGAGGLYKCRDDRFDARRRGLQRVRTTKRLGAQLRAAGMHGIAGRAGKLPSGLPCYWAKEPCHAMLGRQPAPAALRKHRRVQGCIINLSAHCVNRTATVCQYILQLKLCAGLDHQHLGRGGGARGAAPRRLRRIQGKPSMGLRAVARGQQPCSSGRGGQAQGSTGASA